MIARLGAFALLAYALGFALFAVTLGEPAAAGTPSTQAIVVLTGGAGRIERGVATLAAGEGRRMLIAGADPSVTKADLVARMGGSRRLFTCCVDLGSESVDTRSNAEEARRWLERRKLTSLRLVTSDWHMRRAAFEFRHALGEDYRLIEDSVGTRPPLMTLFGEYNKYLLRRLSVWADL